MDAALVPPQAKGRVMDNKALKSMLKEMTGGEVKVRKGSTSAGDRLDIFLPKAIRMDPVRCNILMREVERVTGRIPFMEAMKTPGAIRANFHLQPIFEG